MTAEVGRLTVATGPRRALEDEMGSKILVSYLLSDQGQREAIRLGVDAARQQTIEVTGPTGSADADTVLLARWTALPGLHVDEEGVARVGIGLRTRYPASSGGTYVHGPSPEILTLGYTEVDGERYPERIVTTASDHAFDSPQTAAELLEWEEARLARTTQEREEFAELIIEARSALEGARARVVARQIAQARARVAILLEEADSVGATGSVVDTARQVLADPAADLGYWLADQLRAVTGTARRQAAERAYADERAAWATEHGSALLRESLELGVDADRQYRDERLAVERPGWVWARRLNDWPEHEPRDVPAEALALLRRAREVEPASLLVWTGRGFAAGDVTYLGEQIWLDQHVTRDGAPGVLRDVPAGRDEE